ADEAEAGAEDGQVAPLQPEAILEKQRARRGTDEAEAGAEEGQEPPPQAEAPRPESSADVAAPPPEVGKKDFSRFATDNALISLVSGPGMESFARKFRPRIAPESRSGSAGRVFEAKV